MPPLCTPSAPSASSNVMEALGQRILALRRKLRRARLSKVSHGPENEDLMFPISDIAQAASSEDDTLALYKEPSVTSCQLEAFRSSAAGREILAAAESALASLKPSKAVDLKQLGTALLARLSPAKWQVLVRTGNPKEYRQTTPDESQVLAVLQHTFLVVTAPDLEEIVIETAFRSHFEVPNCSTEYAQWLEQVPQLLVAPASAVGPLIEQVAIRLAAESSLQGRSLAPWRTLPALQSKWQPRYHNDACVHSCAPAACCPAPAAAETAAPQQQKQQPKAAAVVAAPGHVSSNIGTPTHSALTSGTLYRVSWSSAAGSAALSCLSSAYSIGSHVPSQVVVGFTLPDVKPLSKASPESECCYSASSPLYAQFSSGFSDVSSCCEQSPCCACDAVDADGQRSSLCGWLSMSPPAAPQQGAARQLLPTDPAPLGWHALQQDAAAGPATAAAATPTVGAGGGIAKAVQLGSLINATAATPALILDTSITRALPPVHTVRRRQVLQPVHPMLTFAMAQQGAATHGSAQGFIAPCTKP